MSPLEEDFIAPPITLNNPPLVYGSLTQRILSGAIDKIIITLSYAVLPIIGTLLYYTLLEPSKMQTTLGKKALRLTVSDMQGNPISYLRAFIRCIIRMVMQFVTFFIAFIFCLETYFADPSGFTGGYNLLIALPFALAGGFLLYCTIQSISVWATPQNQAIHDLITASVVLQPVVPPMRPDSEMDIYVPIK